MSTIALGTFAIWVLIMVYWGVCLTYRIRDLEEEVRSCTKAKTS